MVPVEIGAGVFHGGRRRHGRRPAALGHNVGSVCFALLLPLVVCMGTGRQNGVGSG